MPILKALEMYYKYGKTFPVKMALEEGMEIIHSDIITSIEGFQVDKYIFLKEGMDLYRKQWMVACALGHWLLGHKDNRSIENRQRAEEFALALHSLVVICHGDYMELLIKR